MKKSTVRIFIPLDFQMLSQDVLEPEIVFAVSPQISLLGEEYGYDLEDCESLAMDYAAMMSCEFEINQKVGRRIVAAATVSPENLRDYDTQGIGTACFTGGNVSWSQIVSFHVDGPGNEELVAAAARDEESWECVSQLYLEWFDVSERHTLANYINR
ncbi:hypothetical protein KRX54_06635 [Actinomycetaceae bacterium TAE3-ERU4]|nr:hypothetical protein [Actinomycetaceae bacterium TAE3-ERU4]